MFNVTRCSLWYLFILWSESQEYSLIIINGLVCWNSNNRLPFIICRPRKTNFYFLFLFAANKQNFAVTVFIFAVNKQKLPFSIYHISLSISIYATISNGKQNPRRFSLILSSCKNLCHFSVCWQRKNAEVIYLQTD